MKGKSQKTENVLVLFNSYGLLYTTVNKEFELPEEWNVLQVSASRWYVEEKEAESEYLIPAELPKGKYKIVDDRAISESGEIYVNTRFGLGKELNEYKETRVLKSSEKANALFSVPGGYRIYYTLKENVLEQFFEIVSPVDEAYVILSAAPEERYSRYYQPGVLYEASDSERFNFEEITSTERKLFVLGHQKGLKDKLNFRNKIINIKRKDWNEINLSSSYTYDWRPADYVIEIETEEDIPAGRLYVYSTVNGKSIPIAITNISDIKRKGEIHVSKSWQVYHSWKLKKKTEFENKIYISGELDLKGNGTVKLIISEEALSGLVISSGNIITNEVDHVEVEIPVSGETTVYISFNYVD